MGDDVGSEKKRRKKKEEKAKMDFVPTADGYGNPYVAFFPSGFDPLQKSTISEGRPRAEFYSYRNPKPISRQQELVAHGEQDVDFVGCNYTGEAAGWQPCDYLLGVYDKEAGSLKLVPLAGEKIFRMEPRVRGLEYGRVIDKEVPEEQGNQAEIARERDKMLVEAFGSNKSKRVAAQRERGRVGEAQLGDRRYLDAVFKEAARNDRVLTTEQALEEANTQALQHVPPHDATATTPEKAYLLDRIITPDEWNALTADVEALKSSALATGSDQSFSRDKQLPPYVLNRLRRVRTEGDNEGNDRRAHILLYMKHLLAFHNAPDWQIKKASDPLVPSSASNTIDLTVALGIPGPIVAKFLEVFTTKGVGSAKASKGCHKNKEHKEMAVNYVLVLGLMVDNFVVDPYDLTKELKLTISQLRPYYDRLGCKSDLRKPTEKQEASPEDLKAGKWKWKVTLPVPLKFPKITQNVRNRGRR